jgi:uncharacterized repeat protein (TIGR01451 family)
VVADYQDIMPYPGKRVTYTVHYSNEGHIATVGVVVVATQPNNTTYEQDGSDDWVPQGDGRYTYTVGNLDYNESGELSFVVTLTTTHFTTAMTNFDATFEIYDAGVSGDDSDPSSNVHEALLGVPNLVIEDVSADGTIWAGLPGFLTVTVRNTGTSVSCGVNPNGECTTFSLEPFFDPVTPPPSYPIDKFGDCFFYVSPIQAGLAETAVFSFTLNPSLPGYNSGYCRATKIKEIWLKVDNWDIRPPYRPDAYGWVPEFNEYDNVFGPVTPAYSIYLPVVLRNP